MIKFILSMIFIYIVLRFIIEIDEKYKLKKVKNKERQ